MDMREDDIATLKLLLKLIRSLKRTGIMLIALALGASALAYIDEGWSRLCAGICLGVITSIGIGTVRGANGVLKEFDQAVMDALTAPRRTR